MLRGIDWQWENQNGENSPNPKGKVVDIREWNSKSPMSGIYVQWDNGTKNMYRLGFEGQVSFYI